MFYIKLQENFMKHEKSATM